MLKTAFFLVHNILHFKNAQTQYPLIYVSGRVVCQMHICLFRNKIETRYRFSSSMFLEYFRIVYSCSSYIYLVWLLCSLLLLLLLRLSEMRNTAPILYHVSNIRTVKTSTKARVDLVNQL